MPPVVPPSPGASRREMLVCAAALLAAVAVATFASDGVLFRRPFWMDEVAMVFLTSERSPVDMLRLVAAGGDWNPPALHLLVWTAMRLTGQETLTPVFLRVFALATVVGALLFLYPTLRRAVGIVAAAAGVLGVAAHALVVEHAFEGRFYGPWLLFASAFAWAVGTDHARTASRRRDILVALCAVLLTTIHWYGIFSLALMVAGALVAQRHALRAALRRLAPALAGPVALLALLPMALSQRESAAAVLWVPPLNLAQVEQMLAQFVPALLLLVLGGLLVVHLGRERALMAEPPRPDAGLGALLALIGMPLILVLLSLLVTPSMVFRYAIVAALAWAPVVAVCVDAFGRTSRVVVVGLLAMLLLFAVRRHVGEQRQFASVVAANAAAFQQAAREGVPVVFQRLHVIYPVAGALRGADTVARYVDIGDTMLARMYPQPQAQRVRESFALDRDQARYHARLFGWPVMAPVRALDSLPRFYLVATDLTLPPGYAPVTRYAAALFPHHRATRLGPALTVLERATP